MKRSKSFSIQKKKDIVRDRPQHQNKKADPHHQKKSLSIPAAIKKHIDSHSDVEMIVFYEQYKQQFFLRCKRLQDYLYKHPQIREKYLSEQNPHFKYAFQYLLLDLFRRGVIVPGSYDNLRQEAVTELENWTLSWIQRKLLYEKSIEQEKEQIIKTCQVLTQLEQYVKIIEVEELPF